MRFTLQPDTELLEHLCENKRSFLDQANQRFDSRVEPYQPRAHLRLLSVYSR